MRRRYVRQKYCACQLIAAVNARVWLGGKGIPEEEFERLVNLTCCRNGAAIGVEAAYGPLGLAHEDGPTIVDWAADAPRTLRWIKGHLPVEVAVNDPRFGFHSVLVTAVRGRVLTLVNASRRRAHWDKMSPHRLSITHPFVTRSPHNQRFRSFRLKKGRGCKWASG